MASILLTVGDLTRDRPDLRLPGIDRLIAHDADHSKTYMQTLRAFIDASGNVAAVATRLNLHTNTVRYRVRRLGEISGLDLENPEHRLVVAIDLLNRPRSSDVHRKAHLPRVRFVHLNEAEAANGRRR